MNDGNSKRIQSFPHGSNALPQQEDLPRGDVHDMTPREYYDIFIRPALDIIREEYSELIGSLFVKYICTGEKPADDALTEVEKMLWNVFMAMVEVRFNDSFSCYSEAFTEDGE